ncbi:MAG: cytochrome c3 family protein [Desulfobacteraceae bacterium]|nr:cytochrome c3 family protein [Desulfobacteraceae bacterium]
MKPFVTVLLAVACGVLWSTTTLLAQEDMRTVPNDVFMAPQRPLAVFVHDEHNTAAGIDECNRCHHVYRDGQLVEDESSEDYRCSDCHAETDTDDGMPALMDAFHGNCKQCHLEKGKGPIMCGECHQRP